MKNWLILCQIWLYFFNHFIYVCGIQCKGWVCKIGEELWRIEQLATCLWLACVWTTHERPSEKYMLEVEESSAKRHLTTLPTRDLASLFCVLYSFLYPHYKNPRYPRNCKENFREIHLRVRDCISTIIYTFLLVFLYSYLSNYIFMRGSKPKHIPHQIWVLWVVLVPMGSIGWSHSLVDAIGDNCGRITSKNMTQWSPLGAET